ncbi:MAG: hypothetical protein FJ109_01025 [Deltaproteobacteria bacterium]|nr:hypothetical protein [Deltaproteobacteria bacterium]
MRNVGVMACLFPALLAGASCSNGGDSAADLLSDVRNGDSDRGDLTRHDLVSDARTEAGPGDAGADAAGDAGAEAGASDGRSSLDWTEPLPGEAILAGAAKIDITPTFEPYTDLDGNGHWDEGEPFEDLDADGQLDTLELGGFGWRHPTKVHDPLWSRSAAFRVHGEWLVLCAVDSLGLGIARVEGIKDKVLARLGNPASLPRERLVIASTHSHAVPDSIGIFGEAGVDKTYLSWLEVQAAESIVQAILAVEPAELTVTSVDVPDLVRDIDEPDIIDPYVGIIQARKPGEGKAIATLVSIANHPETTWKDNTEISADFPFYLLADIETAEGGTAVYFSADLGLMQSPVKLGSEGFERAELIGKGYAEAVLSALGPAAPVPSEQLVPSFGFAKIPAALENPELYIGLADGVVDGYQGYIYLTGEPPCDFFGCLDLPVAVWRLGDILTLVTLPGEFTPELIIGGITTPPDYQGMYPDAPPEPVMIDHLVTPDRFVIGLAGMECGYVYPKMTHDPKAHFSQSHAPGPNMAMALMTGIAALLDQVNE